MASFKTAINKNMPTPNPTKNISRPDGITSLTCVANTVKSGSAIVIKSPKAKHTTNKSVSFFDLVKPEPIWEPIGVIARSAPKLNKPIPNINKQAEIEKTTISLKVKLTRGVKFNKITINVIGNTEIKDSRTFNQNCLFTH